LPHVPQFVALELESVSQPLTALPSQLPKPPPHTGTQLPFEQLVEPCAFVHLMPQPPQLSMSVVTLTSQPLPVLPSQLAKPGLQPSTQPPATQLTEPPGFVQWFPHEPQLLMSLFVLVSQPLVLLPSQSAAPELQDGAHALFEQLVVPFGFKQRVPHAPQSFVLFVRFVSQPLPALPSQLPRPVLHIGAQAPPTQAVVPPEFVHCLPQPPQLLTLVSRLVSQPLFGFPSQLPWPALQVGEQLPPVQTVLPPEFVHGVVQLPH